MFHVLANPTYRRLFTAKVVSLLGTGLATVALSLLAYDLAGDNAGAVLGTAFAVKMIAYVMVAPIAAALVEGHSRKSVLVGSEIVRVGAALSLPFVTEIWQIYLLIFLLQSASATFTPTLNALIPEVLPREKDYTAALSLARLAGDLEAVASPSIAALLLLVVSKRQLFDGTACGFAASALLILAVALPQQRALDDGNTAPFRQRVRRGVQLFFANPTLRPILAVNLVVAAVVSIVLVQSVVLVRGVLGLGESALGLVLAVNGAGSMSAAFLLPRLLERYQDRQVMRGGVITLLAASLTLVGVLATVSGHVLLGCILALWFVIGLGWAGAEVPVGRVIRRAVDDVDLPAAFAAQFSLSHACWLFTYPLVGYLGDRSLVVAAVVMSILAIIGTLSATKLWSSSANGKQ